MVAIPVAVSVAAMRTDRFFGCVVPIYIIGLGLAGLLFRNALNTDAVAYLRLADYYAHGKWDLAISGYWGPLSSWLMAVPLKLGCPPLIAGRLFMGVSALIFLWGCVTVYRSFQLANHWIVTGVVLTALACIYWSVRFITPDLLLGGWIGLATSLLVRDGFRTTIISIETGLFWGLAYLTKAVALPLAILATLLFAGLALHQNPANRSVLLRQVALIFLAFGLIAGPWSLVLSVKYHTPTFSTAPGISHALTGPPDTDRYHPFARTFHHPTPGRITEWEDPSGMPYKYWSPLESPAYAWHQLKVLMQNFFLCLAVLASVNVAGPILLLAWMARRMRRGSALALADWERALIVPIVLFALYLPCQVVLAEQRFFYPAFPFLIAASACLTFPKRTPDGQSIVPVSEPTIRRLTVLGVAGPLAAAVFFLGNSPRLAGDVAVDLARRVQRENLAGPVAGSGMLPGGRTGLYLAFLTDQPWYGDELQPAPGRWKASGARLAVVPRGSETVVALDQDRSFVDLDRRLFADPGEAGGYPVKVYQINSQPGVPAR